MGRGHYVIDTWEALSGTWIEGWEKYRDALSALVVIAHKHRGRARLVRVTPAGRREVLG